MPRNRHHRASGFTLMEAALTTVIVGTGVLAMVSAQQAYHKKNDWAQRTGTAMLLANELREMTLVFPANDPFTGDLTVGPEDDENGFGDFDDLDDFAGPLINGTRQGTHFDPPVNALRQPIADMNGWSQQIDVVNVNPDHIGSDVNQLLGSTDLMRVTVAVSYQAPNATAPSQITQLTWVVGP